MNRLRSLIVEVHRRSLWQVLGIYLVGSWLGYEVIQGLTEGLGLPDWVPALAVVLFIIGLPIVLATAFVQEGSPGVKGEALPQLTLAPELQESRDDAAAPVSDPTRRPPPMLAVFLTWKRALSAGFTAFLLLALTAGGYMGMRVAGVGPLATLKSRGELAESDRLLLADFNASGADTLLAVAITDALRVDLEQSSAVTLVTPAFVRGALQRMEQPADGRLGEALARQLAQREGLKALIVGEVARVGAGYSVSARVVRATDGEALVAARETARNEAELLEAVDRLSRRLRERAGESLRTVRASEALAQVTTPSLEALQLYSQASRLMAYGSAMDNERVVQLLERAIAIDTAFAMAYRALGVLSGNARFDRARTAAMLTRAYELSDRLTERERLLATASYHTNVTGDEAQAVTAYEQLLATHPDDLTALNNLAILHGNRGDSERQITLYRRVLELDTLRRLVHTNLLFALTYEGRFDEAVQLLDVARRRFPDDPAIDATAISMHAGRMDFVAAQKAADAALAQLRAPIARARVMGERSALAEITGRLQQSDAHIDEMVALLREAGAHSTARSISFFVIVHRLQQQRITTAAAITALDAALARDARIELPPSEQALPELAELYALVGRPADARRLREQYARDVAGQPGMRAAQLRLQELDAALAVHEGRPADAVRHLRQRLGTLDCPRCTWPFAGWIFDNAGMPDSAAAYYQKFVDTPVTTTPTDFMWRIPALLRAAELQESLGNTDAARRNYGAFLELYRDPDPDLRPRVEAARARLASLMQRG